MSLQVDFDLALVGVVVVVVELFLAVAAGDVAVVLALCAEGVQFVAVQADCRGVVAVAVLVAAVVAELMV